MSIVGIEDYRTNREIVKKQEHIFVKFNVFACFLAKYVVYYLT